MDELSNSFKPAKNELSEETTHSQTFIASEGSCSIPCPTCRAHLWENGSQCTEFYLSWKEVYQAHNGQQRTKKAQKEEETVANIQNVTTNRIAAYVSHFVETCNPFRFTLHDAKNSYIPVT